MLLMFEKGIQRSITQTVKQHVTANNKYMLDFYNLDETSTYLPYLDVNKLYGWEMRKNGNTWVWVREEG